MKTPEQIAAETAKEFCTYTRQVDSTEEKLTSLILAALTEHAKGLEDEVKQLKASNEFANFHRQVQENIKLRAELQSEKDRVRTWQNSNQANADELAALRAVVDEMEGVLKDFSAMMSDSLGIAGYHLNGDVYSWDEGDDPLRAKTDAALALAKGGTQ